MIINVRGTGGSGKSHVAREVLARYQSVEPVYISDRRRPIGYRAHRPLGASLYVPGHYETACGGCDTITSPKEVWCAVFKEADSADVLMEGIIIQDDVEGFIAAKTFHRILVIALDVPLEECLASIASRRSARGDTRPLNPRNTTNRLKTVTRSMERLKIGGVEGVWASREQALALIVERLLLPPERLRDLNVLTTEEATDGFELRG